MKCSESLQSIRFLFLLLAAMALTGCQQKEELRLGTFEGDISNSIIGGTSALPNEFPFMVNIWLTSPSDSFSDHLCGGSLIAQSWVLTAAHCVLEDTSEKTVGLVKANQVHLYIGSDKISGQGGRLLKVRSIHIHPKFSWPKHDVALIELSDAVTDIAPISLNQKDLGDSSTSILATAIGWGLVDEYGKTSAENLQKIHLPLVPRKTCSEDSFVLKKGWSVERDTLCTETHHAQKATCPGDSGGPLVILTDGHYTQIGIVSWGAACRKGLGNAPSANVEGYADVADAFTWIQSFISSDSIVR